MRFDENPIWKQIDSFPFDAPNLIENFPARLTRKGKWTPEFTDEVIKEYKKFLFLIATAKCILIPPPAIDLAWKLHIDYYPKSWNEICGKVLPLGLHRVVPDSEDSSMPKWDIAHYEHTLELYSQTFHSWPSIEIWPVPREWFNPDILLPVKMIKRTLKIPARFVTWSLILAIFLLPFHYHSIIASVLLVVFSAANGYLYGVKKYTLGGSGITHYK